jgi:formate dehydrogenase assembly factor FdhD
MPPVAADPARPVASAADPSRRGRDHTGAEVEISVVEERPLTIYLNAQEIVTAMTIGDYPEYLALGFLRNQGMLRADDRVTGVDYDEEIEVVVVRTERADQLRGEGEEEDPHLGLRGGHRLRRHDGGARGRDAAGGRRCAPAGSTRSPADQHAALALPGGGRDPRHRALPRGPR